MNARLPTPTPATIIPDRRVWRAAYSIARPVPAACASLRRGDILFQDLDAPAARSRARGAVAGGCRHAEIPHVLLKPRDDAVGRPAKRCPTGRRSRVFHAPSMEDAYEQVRFPGSYKKSATPRTRNVGR